MADNSYQQKSSPDSTDVLSLWKDLEAIAKEAILTVDGVLGTKENPVESLSDSIQERFEEDSTPERDTQGVHAFIDQNKNETTIDADIILEYGKSGQKVFEELKKKVIEKIQNKKGIKVVEVNINISDILSQEEYQKIQKEKEERAQKREETASSIKETFTPKQEFDPEAPLADEGVHYEGAANKRKYKHGKKHSKK